MWEPIVRGLAWLTLVVCAANLAIFAAFVSRSIWSGSIKPRLIPVAEIDRMAVEIIADYADPEAEAFARHQRAWHRCEGAKQVYWYRVRKAVRRRLEEVDRR